MKKIVQTINPRKFKTGIIKNYFENNPNTDNFYVLYKDGTYEEVYFKNDLIKILEKDHIKPVMYIFDATDRIIVDREIYIDVGGIINE